MIPLGTTIDKRYEVQAVLGRGGMGTVYRVRHVALDRIYALKELALPGPAAEAQFLAEARILADLAHPGLPRVSDFFVVKGRSCLVMEHVPGEDLQALLDARGAPFDPDTVRGWLDQLLAILSYVHAKGVVHRDIKPANLKLAPDGRLALVDFGIAKAGGAGAGAGQPGVGQPGKTAFGAHGAFTPHLAAPEQVLGQPTGPRTDLYAASATAAYLLTNQLPPAASGLPAPLGPWLARGLAPDPAGRWADAQAMRQALAPAAAPAPPPGFQGRRDIRR